MCCVWSQVQLYMPNHSNKDWNRNYGPLRPHAYIPPTVHTHTFTHLPHSSPTHTSAPPLTHTQGLPTHTLLSYQSTGPLTATHHPTQSILPPPPPPLVQHSYRLSHPQGGTIVHQVTLGVSAHPHHPHRLLPSPTVHPHHQPNYGPLPHQFQPPFPPPHPYMASPAAYTSFPLSPTKLGHHPQFSYIWRADRLQHDLLVKSLTRKWTGAATRARRFSSRAQNGQTWLRCWREKWKNLSRFTGDNKQCWKCFRMAFVSWRLILFF